MRHVGALILLGLAGCAVPPLGASGPLGALSPVFATQLAGPGTYLAPMPTAVVILKPDDLNRNRAFCAGVMRLPTAQQVMARSVVAPNLVLTRWLVQLPEVPAERAADCDFLVGTYDYARAERLIGSVGLSDGSLAGRGPFLMMVIPDATGLHVAGLDGSAISEAGFPAFVASWGSVLQRAEADVSRTPDEPGVVRSLFGLISAVLRSVVGGAAGLVRGWLRGFSGMEMGWLRFVCACGHVTLIAGCILPGPYDLRPVSLKVVDVAKRSELVGAEFQFDRELLEIEFASSHDLLSESLEDGPPAWSRADFCPPEPRFPDLSGTPAPSLDLHGIYWRGRGFNAKLLNNKQGESSNPYASTIQPMRNEDKEFIYSIFILIKQSDRPEQSWDLSDRKRDICVRVRYPGSYYVQRGSNMMRVSGEDIEAALAKAGLVKPRL